ncbi:MAG: hypothetical protein ABIK54_07295, partial [candidate division WOR-3 bacterium]
MGPREIGSEGERERCVPASRVLRSVSADDNAGEGDGCHCLPGRFPVRRKDCGRGSPGLAPLDSPLVRLSHTTV